MTGQPGRAKKRGAGRPPVSRGEDTRREIVEAATRLFSENKGELTSFESIARAAGVSRTALYYYFPSKADLARAVLMPSMDWNWWRIVLEEVSAAESFHERLQLLLSTCLERAMKVEGRSVYFSLVEASSSDDEIREALRQYTADMRESVRVLVNEGIASENLPADTDPSLVVDAILGLIWCVSSGAANAKTAGTHRQIAQAVRFMAGETTRRVPQ